MEPDSHQGLKITETNPTGAAKTNGRHEPQADPATERHLRYA
jgi:hypothetical protein